MTTKNQRKHYSPEYKEEALKLTAKIGVTKAPVSERESTLMP